MVDVKAPGSGEVDKNRIQNYSSLNKKDQLKFVLADRADYDWALTHIDENQLLERCDILFSPVYNQLSATDLGDWILAEGLPVRLQIQLHKLLWGEVPGT